MDVYDPEKGGQDYHYATLLFMNLEALFYRYRMRQAITCSVSQKDRMIIEDSGCVKLFDSPKTKDGIGSVYYSGLEQAKARPATGFGMVMTHIWGSPVQEKKCLLDLSDREKDVLRLVLKGLTYKEAAKLLNITFSAFEGRFKRIVRKAQAIGLTDRKSIKAYAIQNYAYFL